MSKHGNKNARAAAATAAAFDDTTKLDAALQRWSPAELTVVAEALEENHLASARTIWFRMLRQVPQSEKKPRDLETLLERVARLWPSSSEPERQAPVAAASTADDEAATSLDAFLCMLDDLVPGGLDFSSQLADVLIESAGNASGQLAEAHLFLASLLDGRSFNDGRLSTTTCRRLLQMLSDLLPAAKSAAPQAECLRERMGLAHTAASLPRAIDIRDKVQTRLRMPLTSEAALASAASGGLSDKVAADTWLRSRFTIMADYAAYSMNPLNLPDQLLHFSVHPDDAGAEGQMRLFSLPDTGGQQSSSTESFMERYISSRVALFERMRLQDAEEQDEEFLLEMQARPVKRGAADATPPVSVGKRRRLNIMTQPVLPAVKSSEKKKKNQKSQKKVTPAKNSSRQKSSKVSPKGKTRRSATTKQSSYLEDSDNSSNEDVEDIERRQQPVLTAPRQGQIKSKRKSQSGVQSAARRENHSGPFIPDTVRIDPNQVNVKEFIVHKSKSYVTVDASAQSRPQQLALLKPPPQSVLAEYASQPQQPNSGGHPLILTRGKRGRKIQKGTSAEGRDSISGMLYSGLAKPVGSPVNWTASTTVAKIITASSTGAGNTEAPSK